MQLDLLNFILIDIVMSSIIREKNLNLSKNFIGSWFINKDELCQNIIKFFEDNTALHKQGVIAGGENINIKQRVDLTIKPNDIKENPKYFLFNDLIEKLYLCYKDYLEQWPILKSIASKVDIGAFHIGKYSIGDHYSSEHCERMSLSSVNRLFAFMLYLNEEHKGGNTIFTNYKIKIKPKKNNLLIWPAEWTHSHYAEQVSSGNKYIITGWIQFSYE
mgnify:CR=1 FL=1